ncbi:hypothetical protein F5Y12DRAFT_753702, partial [Xylaria sp. FL1777]
MTTIMMSPFLPQAVEVDLLSQQLQDQAWTKFRYVLSQTDIEELLFTDMWSSLEELIEYMHQDGVSIGTLIPGTTTYKPPATAQLYSTLELDAMDAGVLPLDYGLPSSSIPMQLDRDGNFFSDDEDDNIDSILADYAIFPEYAC